LQPPKGLLPPTRKSAKIGKKTEKTEKTEKKQKKKEAHCCVGYLFLKSSLQNLANKFWWNQFFPSLVFENTGGG